MLGRLVGERMAVAPLCVSNVCPNNFALFVGLGNEHPDRLNAGFHAWHDAIYLRCAALLFCSRDVRTIKHNFTLRDVPQGNEIQSVTEGWGKQL